MGVTAKTCN